LKDIDPEKLLSMSQKELNQLAREINSSPLADFLGLSPDEVSTLIYPGSSNLSSILNLTTDFDLSLLSAIPALERAMVILKRVSEVGALKGTSRGFLPKKLVNEVYRTAPEPDDFIEQNVGSEGYELNILSLRENLMHCGWLNYERPYFTLSDAGNEIAKRGFNQKEYLRLLQERMFGHDWCSTDLYLELDFIQQSCFFLCFILFQQGGRQLSYETFARTYVKAFPIILESNDPEVPSPLSQELIEAVLELRFIKRFARFMGLVEVIEERTLDFEQMRAQTKFATTKLFKETFKFTPRSRVPFQ